MLLQTSLQNPNVSLSSSLSYSRSSFPWRNPSYTLLPHSVNYRRFSVSCSISQVHSYGTLDYERRPMVKWNAIYKRISLMENPELGSGTVLNQWEKEGRQLSKWELCRVIKELRKFKRFERALEVYYWMNNRGERFRLSSSDAAIQLDLIAKVHGISAAENFFLSLSDSSKDKRIYGALLNAYVRARMKEKAESLLDKMRIKGHATHSLPYNVMMTLYMNLKEYEKVELMVSEILEKNIKLDVYSYNIWLSCCGSQGSAEKMEEVFEQLKSDKTINPNWTTFSTMATMYIKMGNFEKAEECLRKVESRISGRDRIPYHYLLSLYASVGNREEIYRVWNIYKSVFPSVPNLGYLAIISSLLRIGDIDGSEKIYEEWLPVRSSYDPRIANLFMVYHIRKGNLEKALSFIDHIVEVGGKPNSATWEALAEGHTGEKRISRALFYWKEAFAAEGSKNWRPKPANVSCFLDLCEQEGDLESKEVLVGLLRESGYLKDELYASLVGLSPEAINDNGIASEDGFNRDDIFENKDDESEMVLNQLQGSA
ncbi:Tetratricopeptide-like helical domain containing protein [Parasponia andersonii]|uniref:Tetratricopeptide-like helical domain containing protein n=1 Tax=Parasponia andersonii TaxID=3476 RepID=A0A2P5CCT2_PARAD|nr:Tetratricopeptide-like helical domain containing protein [Parasponia andersonii]